MLVQFRNRHFYFVVMIDIVLFVVAFAGAYLLRFDLILTNAYRIQIWDLVPVIISIKVCTFFLFGLYRGMWRYTGLNDLARLFQASLFAMLAAIAATLFLRSFQGIPRSIFLLDAMLTFLLCGAARMVIRIFCGQDPLEKLLPAIFEATKRKATPKKKVLIIGAGGAGEKMLREIFDNPHLDYEVIGFLDDDPSKWGRRLHNVPVFGGVERLDGVLKRKKIDEILIATPAATGAQMRRIIQICKDSQARYRTLPEIGAIIDGKVSIKRLRDVKFEDLLRRSPVTLDAAEISRFLQGKRVLVTGAGGSIGSELCRQIIRFDPKKLILVDAGEENLFNVQMEMQHELKFSRYHCILGRVQNRRLMAEIFREQRPHLCFHAAAYKHVPLIEHNPWEAIYNNVLGSQVVMQLSLEYGAERFVLVSTDKAVRPSSVMGASKRLAELIMQSLQGNGTRFMAVRFGNVIGSSGSVLPLFRRQLEQGGPITVTHPEMTRYFMTIPEAAQLILQAGGLGEGGEIFILEMGTPVKIARMAEDLVRLSGKTPGKDVEIIFTGLRAGEKLYEELITQDEGVVPTQYEKIMVLRTNGWNGKNTQSEFSQWLGRGLEDLYKIAGTHEIQAIREKLTALIPEYMPAMKSHGLLRQGSLPTAAPAVAMDARVRLHPPNVVKIS